MQGASPIVAARLARSDFLDNGVNQVKGDLIYDRIYDQSTITYH